MSFDDPRSDLPTRNVDAASDCDVFAPPAISARCTLLIAASWAGFVAFILYPELQLIAFGAMMIGLGVANHASESVQSAEPARALFQ